MPIQALLFKKDYYNKNSIKTFIEKNKIQPINDAYLTKTYYRLRLLQPDYKKHYYRIARLTDHLDAILQYTKY